MHEIDRTLSTSLLSTARSYGRDAAELGIAIAIGRLMFEVSLALGTDRMMDYESALRFALGRAKLSASGAIGIRADSSDTDCEVAVETIDGIITAALPEENDGPFRMIDTLAHVLVRIGGDDRSVSDMMELVLAEFEHEAEHEDERSVTETTPPLLN